MSDKHTVKKEEFSGKNLISRQIAVLNHYSVTEFLCEFETTRLTSK